MKVSGKVPWPTWDPLSQRVKVVPVASEEQMAYKGAWIGFLFLKETEGSIGLRITHLVDWFRLFPITSDLITVQRRSLIKH